MLRPPDPAAEASRGTNQSGMRAYNERLVLTLVRQAGAIPKSEIARVTGLSMQTASVIVRSLEQEGLLARGEPTRGRIGQPSVPMSLAADGAYFVGLKVGRRSTDLILVDFLGKVVARRRRTYPWPTPDPVVGFVRDSLPGLIAELPPERQGRIGGLGIAMPFQLWLWAAWVGAPQAQMDAWRDRDLGAEIAALTHLPVMVQNDATAACGAELVFGTGERPRDFLYFYIAHFIGGGLVLNGRLHVGRTGNAAAIGSMPVPSPEGGMRQLIAAASLSSLEQFTARAGVDPAQLFVAPTGWVLPAAVVEHWLNDAATAIAHAIVSASAVIDFSAALIDGWMPADLRERLVAQVQATLGQLDFSGLTPPDVRQGSVGPDARARGAAAIPLSQRYLLDLTTRGA